MKQLLYVLMGLVTLILQGTLLPAFFTGLWMPNLILIWIIMLAALRSRKAAMYMAIIGGVLHDTVISNFFGLHLFPYVIVAYIFSSSAPRIYQEQWYLSSLTVALGTLLDALLRSGMLLFMDPSFTISLYFINFLLPQIIANAVIAILVHWILWRFDKQEVYPW